MPDIHEPLSDQPDELTWDAEETAITGMTVFMESIGIPPREDEHLRDTPRRVVRMYRNELLRREEFTFTTFPSETTGMVIQRDIEFVSICSHHLVPFIGSAHVAYIPRYLMAGLSKLARLVEWHARVPTRQEKMTEDIAADLVTRLSSASRALGQEAVIQEPMGVAVCIEAQHLCMAIRGVQKPSALTRTMSLRGAFLEEASARAEFLSAINGTR